MPNSSDAARRAGVRRKLVRVTAAAVGAGVIAFGAQTLAQATVEPARSAKSVPSAEPSRDLPTTGVVGKTITFTGGEVINHSGVDPETVVTVASPDDVVAAISPNKDETYSFTPAAPGDYTVSFSVTDATGETTQESSTVTVTDDGAKRIAKPGSASAAQPTAEPAAQPAAAVAAAGEPDIRFAAIGDIHNSWSELAEAFDFWGQQNVSTALFVGDITNNGTASEFQGMKNTLDSKAGLGIRLVASMGNHDVYGGMSSYDLFTQSTGGQKPNADYLINGYHFITVSPGSGTLDPTTGKPSEASTNNYAYAATWAQQRLAAATAEDPTKPVFVLVHAPLQCTHYVSNEWYGSGLTSGCGVNLQSTFDAYPQAVVWSGHIHTPNNISSSIWQGQEGRSGTRATQGFTTVNAPSMAYFEFEQGVVSQNPTSRSNDTTPDDAGDNRQTTIVEVTGSQVTIKNYDLLADQWINQTWTWNVADSVDATKTYDERFPLNSARRASQTSAPVWPAGSAVTVSGIANDKAMVTFPQAVPAANPVQDIVHKYRYTTVDVATGQTVNTFLQWSSFYKLPMPATKNHEVWGLTSGRQYEVRITPINTWGKEGAAITARFVAGGGTTPTDPPFDPSTLTFDDLVPAIPAADLLDVAFQGGTAVDRSPKQRAMTAGADASVVTDAEVGMPVSVGREGLASAYRTPTWSDADYTAMQDGFTLDTTFKLDSINKGIGGYVDVFGGMQGAGIGLEAVKTSSATSYDLQFWYSSPRPTVTLEYGKWYHVTGWYNGTDARLYVNGLEVTEALNVGFNVKPGDVNARYMTIGGDANGTGALNDATMSGKIAGASLSSAVLSDKDVYRTAMKELTKLDEAPPMVRVSPAPPASATVGTAYTAPAGQAVDNSGRVTLALEVTGPNGAAVTTTPVSGGGYRFTPAVAGAYTLRYTATDAAARQASAAFTVNTSTGVTAPSNPIRNPQSGRCLDTTGGSSANGTRVVIYDCNASASQDWKYVNGALVGKDGKCLDANGGSSADGTALIVWSCSGNANQKWTLNSNGTLTGIGGKCVDVAAGGTANGTAVRLWTCNGTAAQKWAVALVNPTSGRCLDAGATNGARAQISDCNRSVGQRWTLNGPTGSIVGNAGRCLDASGGSSADGTAVIVWNCSGGNNQKWTLNADGTVTGIGGKCLGTVASGSAAGTQLELRTCSGGANQKWVL